MLYKFTLELSDIDRGLYQTFDFRVAQHPSESLPYLLTRTLAYVLSYKEGLDFSPGGLGDPDAPALQAVGSLASIDTWIEVGSPSARRIHKASKAAKHLIIYTYKNPEMLMAEIRAGAIHRAGDIKIYALDPGFLLNLENVIAKTNRWSVLLQQGQLDVSVGDETFTTEVRSLSL